MELFRNNALFILLFLVGDVLVVALITYFMVKTFTNRYQAEQKTKADGILQSANENARTIELEAKDRALKILSDSEAEIGKRRMEITHEEERLHKRRTDLDNRVERLEQREQVLNKRQGALDKRSNEVEKMYSQQVAELQRVAQMSIEEARGLLLAEAEKEARGDMARIIRQIESEARAEGEKRARQLIAEAIQRVASDHVSEVTTSIVTLPNEEMKGRIVGRNGRNIRAFEQAAGVDVIVDDIAPLLGIDADDITVNYTGLTTGEKIDEDLINITEIDRVYELSNMYVILNDNNRASDYDGLQKTALLDYSSQKVQMVPKTEIKRLVKKHLMDLKLIEE